MGDVQLRLDYCFSIQGLLKWCQMVFSGIILGLLLWESLRRGYFTYTYVHEGEDYTIFVAAFTIAVIMLMLLLFFLNCHNGPLARCQCSKSASVVYFLLMLMWLAAAAVEVWVASRYRKLFGIESELFGRRAAAAAFCFANMAINGFSVFYGKYNGP
ncbi:hypothetical protein T07_8471 [Trichinella nelsoni]|uniref:MARVEL domain-containing protein n=5 Tax=Trichinella TaxID=6333 RepID=A0A0V1LAE1_9BILA|nr:hypothetical protein T07_8471 [Trichinella nelsoni]KRX46912.1 hypothetical protein T05_10065 [Trichinella murrelli]KRX81089.1 hypothetical protein T06_8730 [Trichinella sp. T6]KRY19851.1 hypothetical protein T12_7265 [Trichinella patagoniensis]KRZ56268.1 hypothetical protein T02_11171 [Trichinella nativa]